MVSSQKELRNYIRSIPDFPKKGILFRDITTLLGDAGAFRMSVDRLAAGFSGRKIDQVVSIESRGFIFGGALAYVLGAGFVPVRKPKKLPWKTIREEYELEYGTDALEIHSDALRNGSQVIIVDDLLATGGTAAAACRLVSALGGSIAGLAFLIELSFLNGRQKLRPHEVTSLINYGSE